MSLLSEVTALVTSLGIPVETGVFSGVAPDAYVVITPLADTFALFADDKPGYETQEARLSVYSKGSYLLMVKRIVNALLEAGFTIVQRLFIGHEDETGYFHYAVDAAAIYPAEG
jgi:hypothetical protein